jgi:hypothetical protein
LQAEDEQPALRSNVIPKEFIDFVEEATSN